MKSSQIPVVLAVPLYQMVGGEQYCFLLSMLIVWGECHSPELG